MHRRFCCLALAGGLLAAAPSALAQSPGPESEGGPTNGHGAGPGMDVPTNGYASPPVEGVGSEAGPLASPAPAPAPQGAMPQTSQSASCDIAGQWRMDTANVGQSTWTFTSSGSGSYAGQEQGLGNATGTAAMNGSAMRLEWRTGGYSGLVEITIDPSCSSGQGYQIFHTGRTGSESTRWTRIGAAPAAAAAAAATGGDAGSDAAGPAPSPIKLHAVIGGVDITAVLIRTGPDSWEWVERGNTFRFRPLLDSSTQLVIYDRSRDMFHRLNFKTGETAWRVGKLGGGNGNWNPHYTIMR
jgi:hypothetical protein